MSYRFSSIRSSLLALALAGCYSTSAWAQDAASPSTAAEAPVQTAVAPPLEPPAPVASAPMHSTPSAPVAVPVPPAGATRAAPQVAATAPEAPYATSPSPSAAEIARASEFLRLRLRQQELLDSNRRWQVPAVGLGLGVSSLIIGGIVFASGRRDDSVCYSTYAGGASCASFAYNRARDVTGLVMMPVGAALVLVAVPMLVVRLVRQGKLKRVERSLNFLSQHASVGHGSSALTFRF